MKLKVFNDKAITKIQSLMIIIIIVAAAVAGGAILYLQQSPEVEKKSIRIGTSQPLSGKYAREGRYVLDGILFWKRMVDAEGGIYVKEYGKRLPVELIYYDDMSDKDTAIKLAEKLIMEDRVDVVITPYTSALAYAVTPIFEKYKMFNVACGCTSDKIFERGLNYTVQVMPLGSTFEIPVVDMLWSLGVRKLAIIVAQDESALVKASACKSKWESLGGQVVMYETYPADATDLTPLVIQLRNSGAEALIGGNFLPDGLLLMRQMKENGVYLKHIDLFVAPAMDDFYKALGADAENVTGISVWEPTLRYVVTYGLNASEFGRKMKEVYGYWPPPYQCALGYFAGLLIQKLIEEAGTLDSWTLRQTANTLQMTSLLGTWKIDPKTGKQIGHKGAVIQWINGTRKVVWPPEVAETQPRFPRSPW